MASVVGFLIISFGIWGIGDIFRGFGVSTVAKIGNTEISMDQFRVRYNEQLQQLSRQVGRPITPEQARAFGLEQQLLGRMVAFAVLDQQAKQTGAWEFPMPRSRNRSRRIRHSAASTANSTIMCSCNVFAISVLPSRASLPNSGRPCCAANSGKRSDRI